MTFIPSPARSNLTKTLPNPPLREIKKVEARQLRKRGVQGQCLPLLLARPPGHGLRKPMHHATQCAAAGGTIGDFGGLDLPPEGWKYIVQLQSEAATRERELAAQLNTREREFGEIRADLERSLGDIKLNLEKASSISQSRATQILKMQGRLNMRGMLELIEREEGLEQAYPEKATRQVKWQQILSREQNVSLQACFASILGWKTIYYSAQNMVKLYDSLSMNQHPIISAEESQRIGGYVLSDDMRDKERSALKCICQTFGIDYRVIIQGEPAEKWTSVPQETELKEKEEEEAAQQTEGV